MVKYEFEIFLKPAVTILNVPKIRRPEAAAEVVPKESMVKTALQLHNPPVIPGVSESAQV